VGLLPLLLPLLLTAGCNTPLLLLLLPASAAVAAAPPPVATVAAAIAAAAPAAATGVYLGASASLSLLLLLAAVAAATAAGLTLFVRGMTVAGRGDGVPSRPVLPGRALSSFTTPMILGMLPLALLLLPSLLPLLPPGSRTCTISSEGAVTAVLPAGCCCCCGRVAAAAAAAAAAGLLLRGLAVSPAPLMMVARSMPRSSSAAWPLSGSITRRLRGSSRASLAPAGACTCT
jgi:hypothetical protein